MANPLKNIQIKDLGTVVTGSTPPTKIKEYFGKDFLFIKPSDIQLGYRKVLDTETKLSQLGYQYQIKQLLPAYTTCVVCIGTIGKICLTDQPSFTNQQINSVIVNRDIYDPIYVYYLLLTVIPQVKQMEGGSASGREHVKKSVFETIPLQVVISLEVQRKIAAVLSAYDELIENNNRRIAILEEMAQNLYQEWFVRFKYPGHEGVPLVESELGLIPAGWEVVKLGDVCNLVMGQSPKSEFYNESGEGLPFHQGVKDFGSRFPTNTIFCTTPNRLANAGDILFSVRAPVGRLNIATEQIIIGRGLSAIRQKTNEQAFLFQQLKEIFQEEDIMGSGTIFQSVTKQDMMNIKLIYPLEALRKQFENLIVPIFRILEILTTKNSVLRQSRDLLLPRLISGELDLSELEIVGSN